MTEEAVSGNLKTIEEARAKAEQAAQVVCDTLTHAEGWRWISDVEIGVFDAGGDCVSTINIVSRN